MCKNVRTRIPHFTHSTSKMREPDRLDQQHYRKTDSTKYK